MTGWEYVLGRLPRGDLEYSCDLKFYKDDFFYWEDSLGWWRGRFRLEVCGERCVEWDGDLRGFRAA